MSHLNSPMSVRKTRFIRLKDVLNLSGVSRSKHYLDVNNGLAPPPINLGERAKGYLEHEILSVNAARAAGMPEHDIKQLVSSLIDERKVQLRRPYV